MRLTHFLCRQTERSKEMNLAAVDTSPNYFNRKHVNVKPNTYLSAAKMGDSNGIFFNICEIIVREMANFLLRFFHFSFQFFSKTVC